MLCCDCSRHMHSRCFCWMITATGDLPGCKDAPLPLCLSPMMRRAPSFRSCVRSFRQELQKGRLAGILDAVFQTAFGEEVYPTLEEKAAHLLYFIVKGHPFADGNKRIGAALFLHFLNKNGRLMSADGELHFSQEALVTLTLLLAQSPPEEKDLLIALVVALLNGTARTPASG